MVVPTSTRRAPPWRMMSGMRKPPPISTSSPRETITSAPPASAVRASSMAAALLLTTSAAFCAGERCEQGFDISVAASRARRFRGRIRDWRSRARPRRWRRSPPGRAGARPRLVCSTMPVALMTRRSCMAPDCARCAAARATIARGGSGDRRVARAESGEHGAERIRDPRMGGGCDQRRRVRRLEQALHRRQVRAAARARSRSRCNLPPLAHACGGSVAAAAAFHQGGGSWAMCRMCG